MNNHHKEVWDALRVIEERTDTSLNSLAPSERASVTLAQIEIMVTSKRLGPGMACSLLHDAVMDMLRVLVEAGGPPPFSQEFQLELADLLEATRRYCEPPDSERLEFVCSMIPGD